MASKNLEELQLELQKLKEKEARVREELALKKKAVDARAKKDLARKKYLLADIFVEQFGEEILEYRDGIEFFISLHVEEIQNIVDSFGKQE